MKVCSQMFEQGEDVDEVELHGEMSIPVEIAKKNATEESTDLMFGYLLEDFYNVSEREAAPYNKKYSYNYFQVIGLSEQEFESYAEKNGIDPKPYLESGSQDVLYYDTYGYFNGEKQAAMRRFIRFRRKGPRSVCSLRENTKRTAPSL